MLKFYQNNSKITKDDFVSNPSKLTKKDEFKFENGNFSELTK
jgi:hypothetical protein